MWSWSLVSGVDSGSDTASPLLHSFPNDQQIVTHFGDKGVEPTRVSLSESDTTQNTQYSAQPIQEFSQNIQEKSHSLQSENREHSKPESSQADTGVSDRKPTHKPSSGDNGPDIDEVTLSKPKNEPELGTIELRIL